jgi:SNF2 family DNA or RNA helicase
MSIDFNNIKMVSQPRSLKINLYPHQLAHIYQMEKFESDGIIYKDTYTKYTKIGVNADITGYGKTLSMIGLIVRDKMEWDLEKPYVFENIISEAKGRIKNFHITRYNKLSATLILVSPSIIGQWVKEFANTELKIKYLKINKDFINFDVKDYDVILVVPSLYNKLLILYGGGYAWKRFIFDEPGHTKVPSMRELHANFIWLITATPNSISNLHRKCEGSFMKDIINNRWSDFEEQFSDIIIKNNDDFVKASFKMPQTNHYYYECYQPVFNALKNYVSPTIKTMIEAGNISGAIYSLGGEKTDNIFEFVKAKKREELIEINAKIEIYTIRNDRKNLNEWINKKNSINNQIDEIDLKFKNMLDDMCPICYDNLKKPILEQNCQNLFCGECLFRCLEIKNDCPMCRSNVDISKLIYIDTENSIEEKKCNKEKKMSKVEKIIDIIDKNKDGKYLIFSDHNESFYGIFKGLSDHNIQFLQIKGSINTRERNIELFKDGKVPVIFLNSNYNASGLNLQETTDIILYHQMLPCIENQIIGRANRIGRTEQLNIHHLK